MCYSLLLDGLMAKREQGITIDVAYRFCETPAQPEHPGTTGAHKTKGLPVQITGQALWLKTGSPAGIGGAAFMYHLRASRILLATSLPLML